MTTPAHDLARSRMFLLVEDVDLIISLVQSLPEKPVVADVGAGSGTTAMAVLGANEGAKIFTIDINPENVDWAEINLRAYYDTKNWQGVEADSLNAARLAADEYFDMVMLDTSHEYEATEQEIKAWLPKLKSGGVFWFHDYIGSDVKRAVDEAAALGLLEKIDQMGLGWAGRKP